MSEWRYDKGSGSFRRYDSFGNGGYNRYNGGQGDIVVGSWAFIAFLFLIGAWPMGLVMLLLKLMDTSLLKKKSPSQATKAAQNKVARAAKKLTQTPSDTSRSAKALRFIGGCVAAFAALKIIGLVGDMLVNQLDWQVFLSRAGLFAAGAAMFLSGQKMLLRRGRIARYHAVLGERDFVALEELAAVTGRKRSLVEKDIEYMLQKNLLDTGAFLDAGHGILFRSADAYQRFLKERTEREDLTPKEANEGYSGALRAIRQANDRIPDPVFSEKLDRMEAVAAKIFREVEQHPEKQKQASAFFDYYLPMTLKLIGTYAEFGEAGIAGENLQQAQRRIESIMDNLLENFEKQLDELYRSEAMDVDADIRVMENMLERDLGSVERDFGISGVAAAQEPRDTK